ncbi:hypothetical protein SLEP1_g45493 [Rubroshorea leprosula]|uniref:RecX first three-helical domain-containing protein n=1 Tax=Rubroshorea leprosula TaxID=152421 RepID=A0AAV5LKY5_9ROSI|nr:hypothetical protein SLEP1_g45493 [Rubroshorea leprosula]
MSNNHNVAGSSHVPKLAPPEKQIENQAGDTAAQSSVTFIYQANIADMSRKVTLSWFKNPTNHYFNFIVENPSDEKNPYTCKIDLKTWQFWGKKGLKNINIEGRLVEVYWDIRQAKFSTSPEPSSDYYVAIVAGEEVAVLLGDLKEEAYKRTKKRPPSIEPTLRCKKEHVQGKRLFCTRTALAEGEKEHDIMIENSLSGHDDPEMWISIDGTVAIRVMNLHWRFRGNETVLVSNTPIEIFWDVHDWLYSSAGDGPTHGLFIFKPSTPYSETDRKSEANKIIPHATDFRKLRANFDGRVSRGHDKELSLKMAILAASIGFKVSFGLQFRFMSASSPRNRAVFCLKGKDYSSSGPVRYIPKKSLKPKEPENSLPLKKNDSLNSSALKGSRSLVPVRDKTKESLKFTEAQNSCSFEDLRKTKSCDSLDSAAFKGGGDYGSSLPVSYTAKKSLKANETENSQSLKDLSKSDGCDSMGLGASKSGDFHVAVRLTPLEANEPENTLPFKGLTLKETESCDNLDSSALESMDNSSSISVRHKRYLEANEPQNSLSLKDLMKVESCNDLSLTALEKANSSSVPARYTLNKSLEANKQENSQPLKDMGENEFCDSLHSNQLKGGDYSSSVPITRTTKKSLKSNEPENSPPSKGLRKYESHNSLDLSAVGIKVMNNGPGVARSITFLERSHKRNAVHKNNISHDNQVLEEEIVDDMAVMGNEIMEESEELGQEIMINQGKDSLEEKVLQAGKTMQDVENLAVKLLALRAFTAVELRKKLQGKRFPPNIIEAVVKNFQRRYVNLNIIFLFKNFVSQHFLNPLYIENVIWQNGLLVVDVFPFS